MSTAALERKRFDKGLTIAEAADEIGVSADLLRRVEKGLHRPRPGAAKRIADFYGLKPSEIWPIGGEGLSDPEAKEAA